MIPIKVTEAKTFWQQTKGLLGTSKPQPLLLKTRWGIHTFGMKYAIDVVILDSSNNIVALKPHLKPSRIFLWNPKYQIVVELPYGLIGENNLRVGTKVKLIMG